jgi:hypothetical protein
MECINVGDIYVKTKQQNGRYFFVNYTYIVFFNKMLYIEYIYIYMCVYILLLLNSQLHILQYIN